MKIHLFLVRHCKPSIDNYSGFPGPSLGKYGNIQAQKIVDKLSRIRVQHIYSSDYKRVTETAYPLTELFHGIKVETYAELRGREKDSETIESHVKRVVGWLQNNLSNILNENTVIFAHCGTLNIVQFYLNRIYDLEMPFIDYQFNHTPFGGIWELVFENGSLLTKKLIFDGKIDTNELK